VTPVAARAGGSAPARDAELAGLAATAQRAFDSDAIVVLGRIGGQWSLVAAGGLEELQRERLEPVLVALMPALIRERQFSIPSLFAGEIPDAETLLRQGFAALLGAVAELGPGRPLAAIFALKRDLGAFANEELAPVFARQTAMGLDDVAVDGASAARARAQSLAILDQLVLSANTFGELTRAIDEAVAPLFGAASSGVMVRDERRDVLRLLPGSFGAGAEAVATCQVSAFDLRSHSARVLATGCSYYSNDVRAELGLPGPDVTSFGLERILSVPLVMAGRSVGVLHLADCPDGFTGEDLERADALAPKVAAAVELAGTLFRLRQQRQLEEILSDAAVGVASGTAMTELLPVAFAALRDVTEAGLIAFVPVRGEPIVQSDDTVSADLERAVLEEAAQAPGIRAYVMAPTEAGGSGWGAFHVPAWLAHQRVGTLVALRTRAEPFSREERGALHRLANLAALARATERYQRQRAELARLHERQRIAEDLHDDVAQLLFGAQMSLDSVLERPDVPAAAAERLSRARGLLIQGDTAIRTVITRLSAPPPTDLGQQLGSLVFGIEQRFSSAIHLRLEDDAVEAAKRLRRATSDVLVDVARAVVVEAAREDGPHRLTVGLDLRPRGRLALSIVADGAGDGDHAPNTDAWLVRQRQTLADHGGTLRTSRGSAGGMRVVASVPV
jgi:signal transduction histidine kinase